MNKLDWSKNLRGVYKKWIWGDTYNYSRICDYIQKINYLSLVRVRLEKLDIVKLNFGLLMIVTH